MIFFNMKDETEKRRDKTADEETKSKACFATYDKIVDEVASSTVLVIIFWKRLIFSYLSKNHQEK